MTQMRCKGHECFFLMNFPTYGCLGTAVDLRIGEEMAPQSWSVNGMLCGIGFSPEPNRDFYYMFLSFSVLHGQMPQR